MNKIDYTTEFITVESADLSKTERKKASQGGAHQYISILSLCSIKNLACLIVLDFEVKGAKIARTTPIG